MEKPIRTGFLFAIGYGIGRSFLAVVANKLLKHLEKDSKDADKKED